MNSTESRRPSTNLTLDSIDFRRKLRRSAIVLAASLGVLVLVVFSLVLLLLNSAKLVRHTDQVISEAHSVERGFVTMQTNFRGYRLANSEEFLVRLAKARNQVAPALRILEGLVVDNPEQVSEVNFLRSEGEAWLAFMDSELATVHAKPETARDPAFLRQGAPLFDKVLVRLDRIVANEQQLRTERDRWLKYVTASLLTMLGLAAIAGAPTLGLWVKKELERLTSTYHSSLVAEEMRTLELRTTLRSIGDAVVATDTEGKIAFLNPAAETMMGWTSAEASGRPLLEVFHIFNEETGAKVENPVERVLRENIVVGLANHTVLRARDGRNIPIEDSAAPIRDERGEVAGVILVFHDVTDKRAAARKLLENERRLRFLNELGEATRQVSDPASIMAVTARLLGAELRASRCAYAEVDADGERFTILEDYTDGCESTAGDYELSLFGPHAIGQMHGGDTLVLRDVDAEIAPEAGAAMFDAIKVKAIVCCPLLKEGGLRAMMAVHQTTPRRWAEAEIAIVKEVVERCWATIERARAERELQERAALSELRAEIARQMESGKPLADTFNGCCELLVRHLDAAFARIWTLEEGDVLVLQASAGLYTHLDGPHARVPLGKFKIGRIAENRQAHLTNDVANDPNISDPEWAKREGMVAFAGYPLIVEGRVLGVAALFARHKLSDAALADLSPIADVLAQYIERKRAESALRTSENLKGVILDTSLDGFILMDHEGRITDWNAAAEKMFGTNRLEIRGRLLSETIVPERLRSAHRTGLARYIATREARILGRRFELPALRADGSEFPCEVSITHIPGTEPPLFAGYIRDITESKLKESSLREATERAEAATAAVSESAERFRLLSEVVALQVWTAQPNGMLDFANKECLDYFGVSNGDNVLGNAWAAFVHEDDIGRAQAAWIHSITSGERYEVEFRLRGGDGTYRWFLGRAEAMQDHSGAVGKWFGTNTDVHDLKMAQGEAERANRAKDDFLAVLSHELRTPLTPVLLAAAELRGDINLPAEVRSQLGMMERNIALEARLIDDLLDLTRIAKGKLPLRPQLCDAHSLIGLAVSIVSDEARAKGIALTQEFLAKHSGLMADPSRFQQVIWNLLRNAVKFTPKGGQVSIRTDDQTGEKDNHWLKVEVRDSGIGIELEALDRIFRPFEQGGLSGEHRFGGVGLGLAIARAIVDMHGGTIHAESDGPGTGALFCVHLPGATLPPAGISGLTGVFEHLVPEGSPAESPMAEARPLRLLLVEDHEPTLQILSRLLTRAGHHVVNANSVAAGLQRASAEAFDLVISDLGLPDGTGNDLMEELRTKYRLTGIALTGYGMEDDVERSRQAGFFSHLIKPVDFNQLRRTLEAFSLSVLRRSPIE